MKAKVICVQTTDPGRIGDLLQGKLNEFLAAVPSANVHSTHMAALDIGGPSQADVLVVYTVFYTE
ncbi:MAG TPA: hypothetical protein P5179_08530 [Candidatus Latescibacteria bacterium]|nr:hypothetical protein [Candidatus Latescibacterota bacterium]HQE61053.1 hypothetical protein [Candidatus Latescibacterota bacterium]HQK21689.1 hypothetical protein [Candidatus Latescibacterota bacterium]HRS95299.1 hypothetical protein [Candidatus Latescibacterota bacterium]HRU25101.1 hypothetical protein [Candidatus Latescibacterota bacterium]